MRFDLKLNEIQYIQEQFHFDALLGVEKCSSSLIDVEEALKSKGVIIELDKNRFELSSEYRYLFSAWEKMRYSALRLESGPEDSLFCVLVNESCILLFDQVENDIALEIMDFNPEIMDRIFLNMAELDSTVSAEKTFNISLPAGDFIQLMTSQEEGDISAWPGKLGISNDDLTFYLKMISKTDDAILFLCEDHLEQVGTLTKIVKTPAGYYALKHVTPKDSANEKMVMMVGDAQQIIDSIYIF